MVGKEVGAIHYIWQSTGELSKSSLSEWTDEDRYREFGEICK